MKADEIKVIRRMNRPDLEGRYMAVLTERDALAAALRACEEYAHYADRGPASERDVLVAIESMARAALDNLNK